MKIIDDTLKFNGKWSRKSLTAFVSFTFALTYEFFGLFEKYDSKEYVFTTLLILSGSVLGLTVWDKK